MTPSVEDSVEAALAEKTSEFVPRSMGGTLEEAIKTAAETIQNKTDWHISQALKALQQVITHAHVCVLTRSVSHVWPRCVLTVALKLEGSSRCLSLREPRGLCQRASQRRPTTHATLGLSRMSARNKLNLNSDAAAVHRAAFWSY